ncbi:hypothetical protein DYB26_016124, partial [Aphanomyces astaci]
MRAIYERWRRTGGCKAERVEARFTQLQRRVVGCGVCPCRDGYARRGQELYVESVGGAAWLEQLKVEKQEDVVSRSVNSDIFLHFEILEPLATDAIDVRLTSPSGRDVQAWPLSKGNHSSILVRESGLYTVCFTKRASSSRRLSILYAFDHASIGSRTLTRLPASTSTIVRAKPDETGYTELNLE